MGRLPEDRAIAVPTAPGAVAVCACRPL